MRHMDASMDKISNEHIANIMEVYLNDMVLKLERA